MLLPFLPLALCAPCPPPPPLAPAALTPDGAAHLLTSSDTTACWWAVDDNGEPSVVRHFDLSRGRPVDVRWDGALDAICIDLVDTDGRLRTRVFPADQAVR